MVTPKSGICIPEFGYIPPWNIQLAMKSALEVGETVKPMGSFGIFPTRSYRAVEKVCICALDRHSREGGNPEVVDFKQTGFPIKHSGMTD